MRFRVSSLSGLRRVYGGACVRRPISGDLAVLSNLIFSLDGYRSDHAVIAKRWHVGHNHDHGDGNGPGGAESVFRLGLVADVALAVSKSVVGYLSGSTAVVADAAHSISDIVLSGVAWLSYRAATAPKDDAHPYGHGKFETLGALGISGMLLVTSGGIAWHAIDVLQGILSSSSDMMNHATHGHHDHHHEVELGHPILALSVTSISISVKEGLYWITKRAGDRQGSSLMKANAWHHRSDAVSSVVALVGVGGTLIGIPLLDPLAGLLVSGMIWKAGFETGYHSVLELVDAGVDQSVLDPIKKTITQVEGVKGCHRFRGRRAGSFLYLDLHIEVDPFLSVSAAHDIGEMVRHRVQDSHNQVAEVFIHIDPSYSYSEYNQTKMPKAEGKPNIATKQQEVETIVSNILSTKFSEKMSLECITLHSLNGQILAQVHVTMPPNMKIGEAMATAKEAEESIQSAISSVNEVSIHLRLGRVLHLKMKA